MLPTAGLDAVLVLPVELNAPEDLDCSLDGTTPDDERPVETRADELIE